MGKHIGKKVYTNIHSLSFYEIIYALASCVEKPSLSLIARTRERERERQKNFFLLSVLYTRHPSILQLPPPRPLEGIKRQVKIWEGGEVKLRACPAERRMAARKAVRRKGEREAEVTAAAAAEGGGKEENGLPVRFGSSLAAALAAI